MCRSLQYSGLQSLSAAAMKGDLTGEQIVEFRETFEMCDKDGGGTISAKELGTVMRQFGQKPTQQEIEEMINEVVDDGSGEIDFPEFLILMARRIHHTNVEVALREAFKVFDKENKGHILPEQLRVVLANLGENLSDEEIDELVLEADSDGDGQIDLEEFIAIMNKR